MDQSSTRRKRTPVGYFGKGRLIGGKGVIFPDSYRGGQQIPPESALSQPGQALPPCHPRSSLHSQGRQERTRLLAGQLWGEALLRMDLLLVPQQESQVIGYGVCGKGEGGGGGGGGAPKGLAIRSDGLEPCSLRLCLYCSASA